MYRIVVSCGDCGREVRSDDDEAAVFQGRYLCPACARTLTRDRLPSIAQYNPGANDRFRELERFAELVRPAKRRPGKRPDGDDAE